MVLCVCVCVCLGGGCERQNVERVIMSKYS